MHAIVDGRKEKLGNFRVEPPGLFRGRGQHPKMGKLKVRRSVTKRAGGVREGQEEAPRGSMRGSRAVRARARLARAPSLRRGRLLLTFARVAGLDAGAHHARGHHIEHVEEGEGAARAGPG